MPDGLTTNASDWLDLGAVGAALLIVLVIVILIFRQQSNSVAMLCAKIDDLITSFSSTNQTLSEVIISNDKDQKEVLRKLNDIRLVVDDIHTRLVRVDTRLYDNIHPKEDNKDE